MAVPAEYCGYRRSRTSWRYAIAALTVGVGVVAATGHGVAWADTGHTQTAGSSAAQTGPANNGAASGDTTPDNGPAKVSADNDDRLGGGPSTVPDTDTDSRVHAKDIESGPAATDPDVVDTQLDGPDPDAGSPESGAPDADAGSAGPAPGESPELPVATGPDVSGSTISTVDGAAPTAEVSTDPVAVTPDSTTTSPDATPAAGRGADHRDTGPPATASAHQTRAADVTPVPALAAAGLAPSSNRAAVALAEPMSALVVDATPSAAVLTTPTISPPKPKPLSPIARLLELPGRIINAVLQIFDITVSAHGPKSPISFNPIDELLFAAFRGLERIFGLHRTPAVQPVVPTLTYDGPTTRPTPTVAQFLNASAAEYVLGGVPGGLKPFTVNGWQMTLTKPWSGAAAKAWVTPDNQIIIAYQGTTGGTNLLFRPLMAVSQLMTDLQVIFTRTTPRAFYDSLNFARRVQAEAAKQGYGADDIFVTGHSLGGWEAQYVAQQTGLAGIGFEGPGLNTTVPGNGADSMFINIETYGDGAAYMSTDLPGLQPFMPAYVPGGGAKPHFGSIVMIGDPSAVTPLRNAAARLGRGLIGSIVFAVDFLVNFFQHHLPGVQAHYLDVTPDPGVVPWLGTTRGPVNRGYGALTIPQLKKAASDAGTLVRP